ncbi:MAG: hypothetical protein MSD82_01505 [Prevotella sp.]|nr:hypothetical protein [Prevotella sp.]
MKSRYSRPITEVVYVAIEGLMQATSRQSDVGTGTSSGSSQDHYNDPTGGIGSMNGGESLSKHSNLWWSEQE